MNRVLARYLFISDVSTAALIKKMYAQEQTKSELRQEAINGKL
jgi:hypothetical protein